MRKVRPEKLGLIVNLLFVCNQRDLYSRLGGWIQSADGRIGHDNALQGTTSLEGLSVAEAADFCRRTILTAAMDWTKMYPATTDRLHFCITVDVTGVRRMP